MVAETGHTQNTFNVNLMSFFKFSYVDLVLLIVSNHI